ncbi:MAG: rRNA cytosine-C5-methylase, partial [Candidatus Kapaibacterium sp.]
HERQCAIIADYARYVRPGGILVYVTCSVMREENDDVVARFLASHPAFRPDPLSPAFAALGASAPGCGPEDFMLRLDPVHGGTDGFFIARMRRRRAADMDEGEAA